jgi:integrase
MVETLRSTRAGRGELDVLMRLNRVKASTLDTYAAPVKSFFGYCRHELGIDPLDTTDVDLQTWVQEMSARPIDRLIRPSTMRQYVSAIRTIFAMLDHPFTPADLDRDMAAYIAAYTNLHDLVVPLTKPTTPLDADVALDIMRRTSRRLVGHSWRPDQSGFKLIVAGALVVLAFLGYMRHDSACQVQMRHLRFRPDHLEIEVRKLKTRNLMYGASRSQVQVHHRLESPDCPVRFLERYKAMLTYAGYTPSDYVGATAPDHESLNLQQALKMVVNAYDLPHLEDLTGHSIRVGAASAANAAHVPVRMIMQRMFHKAESSTFGYIRLHVRPTLGGTVFFGRESR